MKFLYFFDVRSLAVNFKPKIEVHLSLTCFVTISIRINAFSLFGFWYHLSKDDQSKPHSCNVYIKKLIRTIPFDCWGLPSKFYPTPHSARSICFVCNNNWQSEENDANFVFEIAISNYIIPIMSSELDRPYNTLIQKLAVSLVHKHACTLPIVHNNSIMWHYCLEKPRMHTKHVAFNHLIQMELEYGFRWIETKESI